MSSCLYLDTSAVLRRSLKSETSPEVETLLALVLRGRRKEQLLAIAKGEGDYVSDRFPSASVRCWRPGADPFHHLAGSMRRNTTAFESSRIRKGRG